MKKSILFWMLLSIGLGVYSQSSQVFEKTAIKDNAQAKSETPNVSQLSRYDDLSINEYLGIPDISIPLGNLKLADINIPLTISYQATGIKVNQDASSVGLGWDLNTLGSMVQIVRGDDDMKPYYKESYRLLPDYFSSNYPDFAELIPGSYNENVKIPDKTPSVEPVQEKYGYRVLFRDYFPIRGKFVYNQQFRYSTTRWDSEPDVFIINILGETLHCVTSDFPKDITNAGAYSYSRKIAVLNKIGYKVEEGLNDETWVVINPHGTRFYFDKKQSFISRTRVDSGMLGIVGGYGDSSEGITSNRWYLTKIETTSGISLSLYYSVSEEAKFITKGNGTVEYVTSDQQINYDPGYPPVYLTYIYYNKAPITYNITETASSEKQYVLSSVVSSLGSKIGFKYTDREDIPQYKRLETITFSTEGPTTEPAKTIHFFYDYRTNQVEGKRLFLNSIDVNGELYNFKYNQTQLPPRNSFAQDYWGYYNGSLNNNSLVPNPKRFGYVVKPNLESHYNPIVNNMSANLNYIKAGILEKLIYPTGGSVEFEYELNTFNNFWVPNYTNTNNPRSADSEGFGLRVKSVIHKDENAKILKRRIYEYYGGKSVIFHQFDKDGSVHWIDRLNFYFSTSNYFKAMSTASLGDVNPFSTHTGIGYDSVSCIFDNISNQKKYKITTHYHNMLHYASAYQPITRNLLHTIHMPSFENSRYPKNGTIKEKDYYNDSGRLVKREEFQYENKKSELFYGAKLMKIQDVYKASIEGGSYMPGISRYLLAYYPIFDFESLLSEKKEISYDGNQGIEIVTSYGYNANRLLSSTKVENSQKNLQYHYLRYPTDYNTVDIYKKMINNNMLTPVIKESAVTHDGEVINEVTTNYAESTTKQLILPSSIQSNSSENNSLRTEVTFDQYNTKGSIQQITVDGMPTVYLWAYSGLYLVAEIKNTTYDVAEAALVEVGLSSASMLGSILAPDITKLDKLRSVASLKNALITTYTYKPLVGMTSMTDPRGVVTTYEYDSFGRLSKVKDANGKVINSYDYHYQNQ